MPRSRTGAPVGDQRDMSSKRTTPAESPVASSRPLESTANDVISLREGRIRQRMRGRRMKNRALFR